MDIRFAVAAADFSVNLMKELFSKEENLLISPVSVEAALLLAANGAAGETQEEFRKLFGGEMSFTELQTEASEYFRNLPSEEKAKFHLANSLWMEENLEVKDEFISKNRELMNAEVCQIPFNEAAVEKMNNWVYKNTDGMIDRIIEEVDPANLLYLLNALSFDGEWQKVYEQRNVRDTIFHGLDDADHSITGLFSEEALMIAGEECDGFVKPYGNGRYSFVAFLPKENISFDTFVANLTGAKLLLLPASARQQEVDTMIPKFSVQYGKMLSAVLMKLGLSEAMSGRADFSGISDVSLGIDEVIHKTSLTLDERGTKAGAVTAVMLKLTSLPLAKPKIYLDRPFVYEIIDNSTLLPLFIGTFIKPENA